MSMLRIICIVILALGVISEPVEDKQALLEFISYVNHSRNLNWDFRSSACDQWTGVTCNHDHSKIIAVRLPGVGFRGRMPPNTISRLSGLQILSLRSNGFTGPFPMDLLNLANLTGLYLESNRFQGPLPLDFSNWRNLSVLNLSNNGFNGSVSPLIGNLTQLTFLDLSKNSLSGEIPDFDIPSLQVLDLSNNNFSGTVPPSLMRFPRSVFSGNNVSFSNSSSSPPPVTSPTVTVGRKHSKFSESAILGVVIGSCTVAFISIALLLICANRKRKGRDGAATNGKKEKSTKGKASDRQNGNGNGRLTFFEGCNLAFDLEDLLRASAEVLGKGTFGTTYKAALEDATTVAVKRLREVVVGRKDFDQQMETVGNIRHDNVAPLRAYYYSKDEKLMVYDYYHNGSLSALLHAKRGENRIPFDWETRIKVAMGAARGIAHIHAQGGKKLVHGNIKASNIFINAQLSACVSDLGLATLMSTTSSQATRVPGYRAPEVTDTRKASQASDVYSFGVVLLELLTGKSPVQTSSGNGEVELVHLVRWVQSVVREEWTGEVFDVELLRYANIEEEMVAMLQIGLSCVSRMPEQRPKMAEVARMLDDIRNGSGSQTHTLNSPSGLTPAAAATQVCEAGPSTSTVAN
ncbi:probable inactive receptor kinase At4g23740 [Andrographis paniculata]|uniref:probable inactive receptor kinase At4g23740 n=1 Tax=Andrographis paniculata TaxID=175694 RepID=UPI0021E98FEF|nr:probable inactive receptor kinase At4g23740 [Andrographis paniculata]